MKIVKFQIELVQSEIQDIPNQVNWIKMTETIVQYLMFLHSRFCDKIYMSFGVENEDVLNFYKMNDKDPDVQRMVISIEKHTAKLAHKLQEYYN